MTHDEIIKILRTRLPHNEVFRISSDHSLAGHSVITVGFDHSVSLDQLLSYFFGFNCAFRSKLWKDDKFGATFDSSFIVAIITVPNSHSKTPSNRL